MPGSSLRRGPMNFTSVPQLCPLLKCCSHAIAIASTSATAPRCSPPQLRLPSSACYHSCSLITSSSATTALWLCLLAASIVLFQPLPNFFLAFFMEFARFRGCNKVQYCMSLVYSCSSNIPIALGEVYIPLLTDGCTDTLKS